MVPEEASSSPALSLLDASPPSSQQPPPQQVARCRAAFLARMQSSLEDVQALGQQTDALEAQFRQRNGRRADARMRLLQEEAGRATVRQEEIDRRWAHLLLASCAPPEDIHPSVDGSSSTEAVQNGNDGATPLLVLYRELEAQRKACTAMLQHKNALIQEAQAQLTDRDEEYVQAISRYGHEIENLLTKMRADSKALRDHYEREMDTLEGTFVKEREGMLQAHQTTINGLLAQQRAAELRHSQTAQERKERFQRELEALRVQDGEDYHQLQIRLEMERDAADRQVDGVKATTQVQQEKLVHDHRILTDREGEKSASLAAQKKKLAKLRDAVLALTSKYQEHDGREKKRYEELTQEVRRLQKQNKDLQHRFRHFECADRERYDRAWARHEQEIQAAVAKVLAIDELLFAQLLGQEWTPPPRDGLLLELEEEKEQHAGGDGGRSLVGVHLGEKEGGEEGGAVTAAGGEEGEESGNNSSTGGSQEWDSALVMEQILLNKMLGLIIQEAGFLLLEDTAAVAAQRKKAAAAEEKKGKNGQSPKAGWVNAVAKVVSHFPPLPRRNKEKSSKKAAPTPIKGAEKKGEKGRKEEEATAVILPEEAAAATPEVPATATDESNALAGAAVGPVVVVPASAEAAAAVAAAAAAAAAAETAQAEEDDMLGASQCGRQRVLRALGIQDEAEARTLLTYFFKKKGGSNGGREGREEEGVEEEEVEEVGMIRKLALLLPAAAFALSPQETYVMVGPDEVVGALQRFLLDKKKREEKARKQQQQQRQRRHRRQSLSGGSGGQGGGTEGGGGGEGGSLWRSMANVLPDAHFQTWQDLEQALLLYHRLLEERGRVLDSIEGLEEENARLRLTVRACVEDRVNGELLVPPFMVNGRGGGGGEEGWRGIVRGGRNGSQKNEWGGR